jgi:hypothetical protein
MNDILDKVRDAAGAVSANHTAGFRETGANTSVGH